MKRSLFMLPDGTELFSGVGAVPAIKSVTYTKAVNASVDLDFAAACAAVVDVELIDTVGTFALPAGTELVYKTVDSDGAETQVGRFLMEAPTKASANSYRFTAYDRMILLDKDLTEWLNALTEWPYTIRTLLDLACDECGIELAEGLSLINGDYMVQKFIRQITGRQLVQWVAGANAMFATIDPAGKLAFSTYTDGGALELARKSLVVTDYSTAPIQRVVVKQNEDDVGVAWPENSGGETYTILDNPLLTAFSAEGLLPYVERIAGQILGLTYTPITVEVWDSDNVCEPGLFYTVERGGREYKTAVFSVKRKGDISTLKSTGNASRTSASAINGKDTLEIIQGRVARMKVSLEEVSSQLSQQRIALDSVTQETSAVVQKVDSISSKVENVETTVTGVSTTVSEVVQKSDSLEITLGRIESGLDGKADRATVEEVTEHFHFSQNGLTIFNTATGMGINVSERQVAFSGGTDPTTVITPTEMETTNLRIGKRVDVGDFAFIPRSNGNLSLRFMGGE